MFGGENGVLSWMKFGRNEFVGVVGARKFIVFGEMEMVFIVLVLCLVGYCVELI